MARHLAWLDAEIARTVPTPPAALSGNPRTAAQPPRGLPDPPVLHSDPDEALARFSDPPENVPIISKTGCWLIFSALLAILLGGLVLGIYVVYR